MSLVRVAMPETEAHLALIASALQAAGIFHFVHNAGMGALFPGLQIASYNARSVMVPECCAEQALEVIEELQIPQNLALPTATALDKWRMVVEAFFLGWFVPGTRGRSGEYT